MPSKRSLFNKTLFGKNLTRFWPLWGGVTILGCLVPLYLALSQVHGEHATQAQFTCMLYQAVTVFAPAFTACYAILVAMLVWGYLYSARSMGFMHTLPVDRDCLYVTGLASGFTLLLLPYVVVGGLLCLVAAVGGYLPLAAVGETALAVICMSVFFFGFATACAMITGNLFALPAFYLIFNFLALILESLVTSLASSFLVGVQGGTQYVTRFLCPVLEIYNKFSIRSWRDTDAQETCYALEGFHVVALYALAGVVFLVIGWLLYRHLESESAGDVVAFRFLRPLFRLGVSLCAALTLGSILYDVIWRSIFQRGNYADALPMAVCMVIGALVGYYIASMLLEKSLRVFRGSVPGAVTVSVAAVVLCLLVSTDVLGLETKVPSLDGVSFVEMNTLYGTYLSCDVESNPELAEAVRELHQAVVKDVDDVRAAERDVTLSHGERNALSLYICYNYPDGSYLSRYYSVLPVTRERIETPGTYDNLLQAIVNRPEVLLGTTAIPEGTDLVSVTCYRDNIDGMLVDQATVDQEDGQAIYQALQLDIEEGNLPSYDLIDGMSEEQLNCNLELDYRYLDDGSHSYSAVYVTLYPSMTHTLHALEVTGLMDGE